MNVGVAWLLAGEDERRSDDLQARITSKHCFLLGYVLWSLIYQAGSMFWFVELFWGVLWSFFLMVPGPES